MTGRFGRDQRIREQREFDRIFKHGRRVRSDRLGLWIYREKAEGAKSQKPKMAVMVSRKTAPSAVVRNRWKRKIREFFRLHQQLFNANEQILIQARSREPVPPLKTIESEMLSLLEKLRKKT
jgi:ribonuclease P protein component